MGLTIAGDSIVVQAESTLTPTHEAALRVEAKATAVVPVVGTLVDILAAGAVFIQGETFPAPTGGGPSYNRG